MQQLITLDLVIPNVNIFWCSCVSATPGCAEMYTSFQSACDEPSSSTRADAVSRLLTDSDFHTCERTFIDSAKTSFRVKIANTVSSIVPRITTVNVTGHGLRCSPVLGVNVIILPSCQQAGSCPAPIVCTSKPEIFLPNGMVRCTAMCDARRVAWNVALVDIQRQPGAEINYEAWRICEITIAV